MPTRASPEDEVTRLTPEGSDGASMLTVGVGYPVTVGTKSKEAPMVAVSAEGDVIVGRESTSRSKLCVVVPALLEAVKVSG